MQKLQIGIIDIVSKGPTKALYARVMNANLASIMPQVIGVWCRQLGHDVTLVCYTGFENLLEELPDTLDLLFIGAFTEAAHTAYALSNLFRTRGAITVLGGPHARCYPEDAQQYFDYVLGFTDRETLLDVLQDCSQHRPVGVQVSARRQPAALPGVRERWEFIEPTLRKTPLLKMVPMIGSLGCPYTCSFCIDADVPYQPMDFDVLREDLRFLLKRFRRPLVAWHDPNFGVRFDDYLDMIEEAVPPGSIDFAAESSLSLLSEPHLKRLQHNGFKALLAWHRVMVRFGRQVQDRRLAGDRQSSPGIRAREPDSAIHPLRTDQFRPRARFRRGRGAVRAYQAVSGPDSRRFSRIFPADRVWPRRRAQPGLTSAQTAYCLSRFTS